MSNKVQVTSCKIQKKTVIRITYYIAYSVQHLVYNLQNTTNM